MAPLAFARAGALALGATIAAATPGYLRYSDFGGNPFSVTYDNRSLLLNGERSVFASVGIHYPRFSAGQWNDVLLKARADGYNMVQTYVFVNAHAPKYAAFEAGVAPWDETGNNNLTAFLDACIANDMFVYLRPGPYVCAEWAWGGYPFDLASNFPGIESRSSNAVWEGWMANVFLNITNRYRNYFADRGGPIVMFQVENELHTGDQSYINWCGTLGQETGINTPVGMCNGNSAPTTINTCNGGDCTSFIDSNGQNGQVLKTQPAMWTEAWMGWFSTWGDGGPCGNWDVYNSTGDASGKAASFLRWFARGASHANMYNWAGGNNFGRTAGSSIVPMYYWDAPLASDNLAQGPQRLHIARTFAAVAAVAPVLLAAPAQLGKQVQVPYYVNGNGPLQPGDGKHIAYVYPAAAGLPAVLFLENSDRQSALMAYGGFNFSVSPGASCLAWGNGTVLLESSAVIQPPWKRTWTPVTGSLGNWVSWVDTVIPASAAAVPTPTAPRKPWMSSALGSVINSPTPLEAVAFTEYDSELAVYVTQVSAQAVEAVRATADADGAVTLSLASAIAQAWTVFVNGALAGTTWELSHGDGTAKLSVPVNMPSGSGPVTLALLSTSLGIGNGGGINKGGSTGVKGITSDKAGSVTLGGVDITSASTWTHVVGAVGEAAAVYAPSASSAVPWKPVPGAGGPTAPLTWLRTNFTAPAAVLPPPAGVEVTHTLHVDVTGLSRGRLWVNGFDLGRYWSKACGRGMCQRYYHVPQDLLLPGPNANVLVILDELGATNTAQPTLVVSTNQ